MYLSRILIALGLSVFPCAVNATAESNRPNIVYILADDLGYHELGSYGQTKIQTPNLDRLAAEGMRFTQHYSGSAVCAPSRCVLLTGRHSGHSFIRGNKEVGQWGPEEPEGQWPIPAEEITLAERLKSLGYRTGAFGKWGLGGPGSTGHPNYQGFDHFYGYLCQRVAHNYFPTHLWRNHDVDVLHGNQFFPAHQKIAQPLASESDYANQFAGGDYAPTAIIEETLEFIAKNKDQPFFAYVPSVIPHLALQAPEEWVNRYPREWDPEHYLGDRGYLPHPRPRAAYAAMISYMDHNVGRILDLLDQLGLAKNTIVMFSSDNGTSWTGGVDREFFGSLGDLRGHKATLWEGGIRVPMIARWPGRIEAGSVSNHLSSFQDVMPTLLQLLGENVPAGLDGIGFAPALLGENSQATHEYLYWEYPERTQFQAVRLGRYKGIRPDLRSRDLAIQLYDLESDPGEKNDIADTQPDVVEQIAAIMKNARTPSTLFPIRALDSP